MTRTSILAIVGAFVTALLHGLSDPPSTGTGWAILIVGALGAACSATVAALQPSSSQVASAKLATIVKAAAGPLACLMIVGCLTKAQGAAVATDITQVGFCELEYIMSSSNPTPEGAVQACAGLALSDAQTTFQTLLGQTTDGGVPTPVAAKLKAVHAAGLK
jgi:hypothetical protein